MMGAQFTVGGEGSKCEGGKEGLGRCLGVEYLQGRGEVMGVG